eukprot:6754586-Pyramimonas_sp.AAC.1
MLQNIRVDDAADVDGAVAMQRAAAGKMMGGVDVRSSIRDANLPDRRGGYNRVPLQALRAACLTVSLSHCLAVSLSHCLTVSRSGWAGRGGGVPLQALCTACLTVSLSHCMADCRSGWAGRGGGVPRGGGPGEAGVLVARQVPAAQAQVLQPRAHRLRVEQVQPDALRPRQPPAQGGAGLQVQRLLPGPH